MRLERVKGIEPSSQPWEGHILPLNHTRLRSAARNFGAARPLCQIHAVRLACLLLPDWLPGDNSFALASCRGAKTLNGLTQPAFNGRLPLG